MSLLEVCVCLLFKWLGGLLGCVERSDDGKVIIGERCDGVPRESVGEACFGEGDIK